MKRESAVLSSRGQLTLPASVRKSVNIKQGDVLSVYEVDERFIIIEKAQATPLEEILTRFEESARKNNLKADDVVEIVRAARRTVYREIYGADS
ncbi:MAG: AbrB/MazE/SpoVT family DNA-binding domain-containing protein [Actinomycetota bacterium]